MNRTTSLITVAAISALGIAALAVGCGDSGSGGAGGSTSTSGTPTSTTGDSSSSGMSSSSGNMFPMPPTIGDQIDRMGRPAISTALNHTFDTDTVAKNAAKDAWNADKNEAGWTTTYGGEIAKNLAILDGLNGVCGDQPLYASPAAPASYVPLGGILADDRLWVDTNQSVCDVYLGVEAKAANLVPTLNDCGGRTLSNDVIDQSYSLLAAGDLTKAVNDGIPADSDTSGDTFPYLAAPH
jgi:hypothetical protein